ncbi:hypothetical protein DFP72DRAFT_915951 [Ephemerocybe angulata]|uniref:MYND-type domain-containing protein n=1 Tax=Ephemerocybe angulata TaxID=980116 RepID=A0A8H6HMX4_9AGAR|nr:hypothetical protein DFP72DRAFT_915951 [Tulosesus angulatus]
MPHSHRQRPVEFIGTTYPHLVNGDTFISTLHTSRMRIANIHGGQFPLIFDAFIRVKDSENPRDNRDTSSSQFMAAMSKEKDLIVRYLLDLSIHPPDARGLWTTVKLETISTSILPGPQTMFTNEQNPTGFFVPEPFFASLAEASKGGGNIETFLTTATFITQFIYSPDYPGMGDNLGLTKPRRACDREGCHSQEDHLGQLKRCSGCQMVLYCGAECQNKDWKAHKAGKCSLRHEVGVTLRR